MAGRLLKKPGAVRDAAALGIVRPPDDPPDAGMADRTGAHGAGLERHIEAQAGEAVVTECLCRSAHGDDLGVGGRVMRANGAVCTLCDDGVGRRIDDDTTHRCLSGFGGSLGQDEGAAHEIEVSGGSHGAFCVRLFGRTPALISERPLRAWPRLVYGARMDKPPAKPFAKGKPNKSHASKDKAVAAPVRKERIAKRLARAGVASRREIERLIGLGRIAVNGRVLDTPAVLVGAQDVVTVDGRPVERPEATRVWRFHKPVGLITAAKDPAGRPTVFDALPEGMPRVVKVGRLDINSEGLLLLTNDGELARALELPTTGWVRRYRARARGKVTQDKLDTLKNGIVIEGVRYGPIEATLDKAKEKSADGKAPANLWISVALTEGKNREVRKVLEHLGVTVNRLIRLSYGPFQLGTLAEGEVAEIGPRVIREQLSGMIHPESLPQGDDVEALPSASKKARAGLADPSMKPSKVRAHAAKQAALAAEISERAERRESRRDGDDRPRRSEPGRPAGSRREFKPRDGEDRPKRAYSPRDRADGDRPRRTFKPRDGEGGDRPQRSFRPRDSEAGDRPRRDFKSRDRADGGDRPKRAFKPRDGEAGERPRRDFKPRDRAEGGDRPKRDYKPRSGPGGPRSGPRPGGKPGGPRPGGPRKPRG